jgi:hypothetical protein
MECANQDKSPAIFCCQVELRVPDTFCNFYLVKSYKIVTNSLKPEKNKHRFGIPRILQIVNACLTKFENQQILLNKISHIFLLTTKLFIGWKSLIANHESYVCAIYC